MNGVNLEAILGARAALTEAPAAAQFTWKADWEWVDGTHSRTTIERFFGVGDEQSHRESFVYDTDHPEIFGSEDHGVSPAEMMLVGLAGCIGAGIATVATNRGINLRSVNATVSGDMDLRGIMGIDREVRNGYSGITIGYRVDADASREEIESVVAQATKRSAVFDVISNPTAVTVEVL